MIQCKLKILVSAREIRNGHRWSYDDIAEQTGLSKNTIYKIANNLTNGVDYKTLSALCYFFDCQPGDLLIYIPDEGGVNDT